MKGKRIAKLIFASLMSIGLVVSGILPVGQVVTVRASENTQTVSSQMPFRELTGKEMVAEMGSGWNLGNTMDGHTGFTPSETIWQNVETTQELILALHDMGFNNIRVPVTWGTMIDDDHDYTIDEKWMSRVQDIVDYAVNLNMYVMINIHHDGAEQTGWFRISAEDLDPVREKYAAVWKQIAERFKDYDEHVIFESMNEVTGEGTHVAEDTATINEFNQLFVDTVRATGSNNELRWLSVPGRYTNIVNTTNPEMGFQLPTDRVEDRLFVAVHYYDWHFGLLETSQTTTFSYDHVIALQAEFQKLEDTFTSKGILVILGEYGAINKLNTPDRAYHMEVVNRMCQQMGIVPCYWDQGWYDLSLQPDYSFSLVDRATCEQIYPEIISAMMRGMYVEGLEDLSDITLEPQVTAITNMGNYEGTYLLHMGEVGNLDLGDRVDKSVLNDVVLWKSADETVATVEQNMENLKTWNANIHAVGIGNTIVTAYAQSGQAVLEIPVEIQAAQTENPCIEITAEQESYTLQNGQSMYLNASMAPAQTDAFLTYRSTDTDVVTVSRIGKLVAKGAGSAYVILTSSDGVTKVVPVTVDEGEAKAEISLSLNVYYNDAEKNFFSNQKGAAIKVSEDGQYTLSFDCAQDLSEAAGESGITGLSNITAIYIKDDNVTNGITKKSPLTSCQVFYDKVTVDGVEFDILMTEPKSALKESGIFDTNDPVNSWDGSAISGVDVVNHVLNFTGMENPQKIEVTFTLSDLVFEEGATAVEKPTAKSIEVVGEDMVQVMNTTPVEVTVKVDSAGSGKVAFVSSNPGIVSVKNAGIVSREDGTVGILVYAHETGEAIVTAYTDNGLTTVLNIKADASAEKVYGNLQKADVDVEDSTDQAETLGKNQVLRTVILIVGIVALAVVVFYVTMKLASGPSKPKKNK